jgi:hypothetical protein
MPHLWQIETAAGDRVTYLQDREALVTFSLNHNS